MADYPEWVMKHKKKGTYINHVNGKYYLYAAHSERVPGTKKVRRVSDGYLGRITEKDGFIPAKEKVLGEVIVYEYGLSTTILSICKNIYSGFKRNFKSNADFVMAAAILSVIYGNYNQDLFEQSFLSVTFPNLDLNKTPTEKQLTAINRGVLMINDTLSQKFGNDIQTVLSSFRHMYKVKINERFYLSKESITIKNLKQTYNIEWGK